MNLSLVNKYFIAINVLTKGHSRSINIKKNILASLILKGLSVSISFILVPMSLSYLDIKQYGYWLTLSSIMGWMWMFDIGLGNGLRNKFAEAMAENNKELARIYVSTSYVIIAIIVALLCIIFLIINPYLSWAKILNASPEMQNTLNKLVIFVFILFALQFIVKLIGTIVVGDQKPAINDLFNVAVSFIQLITIYILIKTTSSSIIYLGVSFSVIPIIVLLGASIFYFTKGRKEYIPSFKYFRIKYAKDLTNIGFQFFIIQIACVVIFLTTNIMIAKFISLQMWSLIILLLSISV